MWIPDFQTDQEQITLTPKLVIIVEKLSKKSNQGEHTNLKGYIHLCLSMKHSTLD